MKLFTLLESNWYRTKTEYLGKDIELTGGLFTIDMDGKYIGIALLNPKSSYNNYYIYCNITNDNERKKIIPMNEDDIITVQGTITKMEEDRAELDIHKILN